MISNQFTSILIGAFVCFSQTVHSANAATPSVSDPSQLISWGTDQRYNDENKFIVGVDIGMHSANLDNLYKFGAGPSFRITVVSLPVSSTQRIQLAATYCHGKIITIRDTWSSELFPISIRSEHIVDITGAELLFRYTAERNEHLIWSIGPILSLDHTSYRQGSTIALGFSTQLEYLPGTSSVGYQLRLDGKSSLFPVTFDATLPFIMGQVSIGVIFKIGSVDS